MEATILYLGYITLLLKGQGDFQTKVSHGKAMSYPRVWDLKFRVWDLGFRVWGLGFRV